MPIDERGIAERQSMLEEFYKAFTNRYYTPESDESSLWRDRLDRLRIDFTNHDGSIRDRFYHHLWDAIERDVWLKHQLLVLVRPSRAIGNHLGAMAQVANIPYISRGARESSLRARSLHQSVASRFRDEVIIQYEGILRDLVTELNRERVAPFDLREAIRALYNIGRRNSASELERSFSRRARRLLDNYESNPMHLWADSATQLFLERCRIARDEVLALLGGAAPINSSSGPFSPPAEEINETVEVPQQRTCRCEGCGNNSTEDFRETSDGSRCNTCVTEDYFQCAVTRRLWHINDVVRLADGTQVNEPWANSNCHDCGFCGETFRRAHTVRSTSHGYICQGCSETHFFQCSECSMWTHVDDDSAADSDGNRTCFNCQHCDEEESRGLNDDGIHYHDFKPRFAFHSLKGVFNRPLPNVTYVGVELEIEAQNGMGKETLIALIKRSKFWDDSKAYLKHDGSLSYGVELVMHPTDVKSFDFGNFRGLLAALLSKGARSFEPGTCGLHVHIGRNVLGDSHEEKLCRMMHRFKPYLHQISKRGDRLRYCAFRSSPEVEDWRHDRYQALNLTNRKTIEFRFFRGTLNGDSAVNAIKFCEELATWTCKQSLSHLRNYSSVSNDALWISFLRTLSPHLRAWVSSRCKKSSGLLKENNKYNAKLMDNNRSEEICA